MNAKVFAGSAWGIPARGGSISLDSADVATILTATAGLAKTLAFVGGGLLLATGIAGCFLSLPEKDPSANEELHLEVMSKIISETRKFTGACLSKEIAFKCENQELSVPIQYVKSISNIGGQPNERYIELNLFDGSEYRLDRPSSITLEFITIAGKQNVVLGNSPSFIGVKGCTVREVRALKENIAKYLDEHYRDASDILGEEILHRFFCSLTSS